MLLGALNVSMTQLDIPTRGFINKLLLHYPGVRVIKIKAGLLMSATSNN